MLCHRIAAERLLLSLRELAAMKSHMTSKSSLKQREPTADATNLLKCKVSGTEVKSFSEVLARCSILPASNALQFPKITFFHGDRFTVICCHSATSIQSFLRSFLTSLKCFLGLCLCYLPHCNSL